MVTLLFLDQSFLSNLAKVKINRPNISPCWFKLYDTITNAVASGQLICPYGTFQEVESNYDSRLSPSIGELCSEFSTGLRFRDISELINDQIVLSAEQYCGDNLEKTIKSLTVMNRDTFCELRFSPVFQTDINQRRFDKKDYVVTAQRYLDQYRQTPMKWETLLYESKKSSLDGILGERAKEEISRWVERGDFNRANSLRLGYLDLYSRLSDAGINASNSNEFFYSKKLFDTP